MINPYLPDMQKVERAYKMAEKENEEVAKLTSLTHPYKTDDKVLSELARNEESINKVLSKMSSDLRKNQDAMLNIISKTEDAYLYVHPSINTLEFKQQAIMRNPSVYGLLSDQDRMQHEISNSYLNAMMHDMKSVKIDATDYMMQFKQQFSEKTNTEQVFSEENYGKAFEHIVLNGPYSNDSLNKEFAFVSTARLLRPEMQNSFNKTERDLWLQHSDRVAELAYNNRLRYETDHVLTAIEERCPEYKPLIEDQQKGYWEERKQELLEIQERQVQGQKISDQERTLIQEGLKHVEIESKQKTIERIQKERMQENVYLMHDAVDRAYSAAASGDIEFGMATDIESYVGNMPTKSSSGRSMEILAAVEAKENDIDNIDINREEDLKSMDSSNKYHINEARFEAAKSEAQHVGEEYDRYEMEFAGNPFLSYMPEEGMEHVWSYK